ncbi:hypothetical protein TRIUR3_05573 [Triticum urartu]|uniref:Pectin acetylesterase n=2 Tax=Triticum TaxID=4564 RepID=A0A9R0VVY7_TRITD|nr:hypothetical protein TRIUR3_05573 [Triticum urartu]VAH87381.1 unnamed protein product [Triticum turgidum subsp. durum]
MASTARITRAALLVAAVVLMQCCNAALAARLLEGDGGWLQRGDGSLIMQALPRGGSPPGAGNSCWNDPKHPPSSGSWQEASNLAVADIDMLV